MSKRKLILRTSALAALGGAALAVVQHVGMIGTAVQADVAPVILSAQPAATPAPAPVPELAVAPEPAAQTLPEPDGPAVALSPLGLPCGLTVTAEAMPGAMVALDVMDPCASGTRVEITHGALRFSERTDAMGLLTLDIPALETPAFFTVRLDTGAEATTLAGLPDLIDYDRAAILWTGDAGLQLHGYRGDAAFGEPGHIWQDNPGSVADAMIGAGGFLSLLGDPALDEPRLAQVVTTPRAQRADMSLVVDVPITSDTCGQSISAESLQIMAGADATRQSVTLTLPGCEAEGEFLMLQNLFSDLRLAAN
jgi:hypothetical protein